MYVGTLTADEIVYSGGKVNTSNQNYYLINDYQKSNNLYFWSLSPSGLSRSYDLAFGVYYNGDVSNGAYVNVDHSFRPAVLLNSSTIISSGEGTISNPYVVE